MENGIHCIPCSYINEVTDMLVINYDVILMSKWYHRDSTKVLSTSVYNSIVAMVTYLRCHLTYNLRGPWHTHLANNLRGAWNTLYSSHTHLTNNLRGAWNTLYAMPLSNYEILTNLRGAWHTVYAMLLSKIISEMLLEIHTLEKCYFLKLIIHSQII